MNDPDREEQLAFLEGYCAAHLDEDGLDELVHELKAREAAAINNGGVAAQLEYLVERLGAAEAARAVVGADGTLPHCFRGGATPAPVRPWRVDYRVCADDGETFRRGTITVTATTEAEAGREAVAWANDHDPSCDARIGYRVEVVHIGAEEDDDEQDDPAG